MASRLTHPSWFWATCNAGSKAEPRSGYLTSIERIRSRDSSDKTVMLTIHFSQHNVDRSNDRDHVGHEGALGHLWQRLQVVERGSLHMKAIRFSASIADQVVAHLAPRTFDSVVHLTYRRLHAFREELEVVNER